MEAQLQRFEGLARDDEFAVQDKPLSLQSGKASDHLREEAVERFLFLGLQIDFVAIAKGEAAEAVIFGLVEPPLTARQIIYRLRFHRLVVSERGNGICAPVVGDLIEYVSADLNLLRGACFSSAGQDYIPSGATVLETTGRSSWVAGTVNQTAVGAGDRALSGGGDRLAYGLLRATDSALERTFSRAGRCQPRDLRGHPDHHRQGSGVGS